MLNRTTDAKVPLLRRAGLALSILFLCAAASPGWAQAPDPDLDDDGTVTAQDVKIVARCLGRHGTCRRDCDLEVADTDDDGDVDSDDLDYVEHSLGASGFPVGHDAPPPSSPAPDPDLNDDGTVTGQDVKIVARCLGRRGACRPNCDFALADTDADGDVDLRDLRFVVRSLGRSGFPVGGNVPPLADAGADQAVPVGATVILDASRSSDADGDALTFQWSLVATPPGSSPDLSDPTAVSPTFVVDAAGTYVVQLIVNDGFEDSLPDEVSISTINSAPFADAGPDQSALLFDTVNLDGSGSGDADGDPLTYLWTLEPPTGSGAVLSDPTAVNPSFVMDLKGSYVALLVVNDGALDSTADEVIITTVNAPPAADAGLDKAVQAGTLVWLNGSGSQDADGDALTFQWALTSAPSGSGAVLSDDTSAFASLVPDVLGTYVAQLIVNDGGLNSLPDSVTVEAVVPTPPRGSYVYAPPPIDNLGESHVVEFHPDGSYAVVLERANIVHLYHWETQTDTAFDLTPATGTIQWQDLAFDPNGRSATLVGYHETATEQQGVVYRLDDAAWRRFLAGPPGDPVISQLGSATGSNPYVAIAYPWEPGSLPIILERVTVSGGGFVAILREFNPDTGTFEGLIVASNSGAAGCTDMAFADNAFGGPGILVVCGFNGAQALYYTEIGGVGEWRTDVADGGTGNLSRTAAHRNGDYALVVSFSDRTLLRFQDGLLNDSSSAPSFTNLGIFGIKFQDTGQRALIVGRATVPPVRGTVLEYRDDEYSCLSLPSGSCDLTEVSIPDFDQPPYNASSNTALLDAAFRPGCDGGLVVGGEAVFGLLIEFQIADGKPCR